MFSRGLPSLPRVSPSPSQMKKNVEKIESEQFILGEEVLGEAVYIVIELCVSYCASGIAYMIFSLKTGTVLESVFSNKHRIALKCTVLISIKVYSTYTYKIYYKARHISTISIVSSKSALKMSKLLQ
jgi:hypothetical protein